MRKPDQTREVEAFNRLYSIGTFVHYWTGVKEGEGSLSRTRSAAQLLNGHTAVVWVEGEPGCISLSHVLAAGGKE